MKNSLGIYLAGPCFNQKDEGRVWRNRAVGDLKWAAEITGTSINVINPLDFFSYADCKQQNDQQVKRFYLDQIKHCRLVLVNLDDTVTSPGTAQELQYAVDNNIQIIGFGTKDVYPWFLVDCQVVFETMDQAIDYIIDYYME